MFKKTIISYDGSEYSIKAAKIAGDLAREHNYPEL
jgi:hypothetical protein